MRLFRPFWVINVDGLKHLKENVAKFYSSLTEVPFDSLSAETITSKLQSNNLDIDDLTKTYLLRGKSQVK